MKKMLYTAINKIYPKNIMYVIFLLGFLSMKGFGQGTSVNVMTTVIPPYSPYFADYLSYENKIVIILTNQSAAVKNVKLKATLTSDQGFFAETSSDYTPLSPYTLQPSIPYDLRANGEELSFLQPENIHIEYNNITLNDLIADGVLPEGTYTLCVQALDYDTGVPYTLPSSGCTTFVIDYKHAPRLITPLCGESTTVSKVEPQNINFSWTNVVGGTGQVDIAYDLFLLKIMEGIDPQDAINNAVSGNNVNVIRVDELTQNYYQYGLNDVPLDTGKYAWAVRAYDRMGNYPIENNGLSQICTFDYNHPFVSDTNAVAQNGEVPNIPIIPNIIPNVGSCQCQYPPQANGALYTESIVGKKIKVGVYEMDVLSGTANEDGSYKGTGTIPLPIINAGLLKLRVNFSSIVVNKSGNDLYVLAGAIAGIKKSNASLMPGADMPGLGIPTISSSESQAISNYFDQTKSQLLSQAESMARSVGFELPLGVDNLGPLGLMAITDITFTDKQATFDAAVIVNIPESNTPLALGARNVCISKEKAICGQGTFYLASDFQVIGTDLTLKATRGFGSGVDSGTYITFKENGEKWMRLRMDYKMPQSIRSITNGDVTVKFGATAASWNDWFAEGSIEDFKLSEGSDFLFKMGNGQKIIYDHSDKHNAPQPFFGQPFSNQDPSTPETIDVSTPTWRGLYIPAIGVQLPGIFNSNNQPIAITAKDILITQGSAGGLCASINAGIEANGNPLLSIGQGNLDGWYYSIDNINLNIWKSSFRSSNLKGKVVLPISGGKAEVVTDPNSQLDYTSTLTFPQGQPMQFQFVIKPKNNLIVPIWAANFILENTSSIVIMKNAESNGNFMARAMLNGKMSIHTGSGLKPLPNIDFDLMAFQGLQIQTRQPYVKCDFFTMGLASPQKMIGAAEEDAEKNVGGFPLTLATPTFEIITPEGVAMAGFRFDVKIKIADVPSIPEASFGFGIYAKLDMMDGRANWSIASPRLQSIGLKGNIGPIAIDGKVDFKAGDPKYGDAILGSVKASLIGTVMIDVNVVFGSKQDYKYFYVDALAVLPAGIQIPPCMALFGLGGGFYYNMSPPLPPSAEQILSQAPSANNVVRTSGDYIPQKGTVGFKVMVVMGLSSKEVLHFKGTYEMSFKTNNGLEVNEVGITGEVFVLSSEIIKKDASTMYGAISMRYNFPLKTFTLNASVEAHLLGILDVTSRIDLLASPDEWYVFVGTAQNPITAKARLLAIIQVSIHAYFMTGNAHITFPDPPSQVISKFPYYTNERVRERKAEEMAAASISSNGEAGVAFGAGFDLQVGGCFGPVCLEIACGVGFDIALTKFKGRCSIPSMSGIAHQSYIPGIEGWYAQGNLYGYLKFRAELDLGLFSATIARMEAAALLEMKGPNPVFVRGGIAFSYNVLGIKGHADFMARFGETCESVHDEWPFGDLPLISEIRPDNEPQVSILRQPTISYNLPVNTPFDFYQEATDGQGNDYGYIRTFKITSKVTIKDVDRNQSKTDIEQQMRNGGYNCVITKYKAFEPLTNYNIHVLVEAFEKENGAWREAFVRRKSNDGQQEKIHVTQSKSTSFKTKECISRLDDPQENAVLYAYPHPGQRYLLPQDEADGCIVLREYVGCLIDKYEMVFRFETPSASLDIKAQAKDFSFQNNYKLLKYTFKIPPTLEKETGYQMTQVGKPITKKEESSFTQSSVTYNLGNNSSTSSYTFQTSYSNGALHDEASEVRLYQSSFRTSKYKTMKEKINSYNATADQVTNYWGDGYSLNFKGGENFDKFEVKGALFDFADKTYMILPSVFFRDLHDNEWYRQIGDKMYSHFFDVTNNISKTYQPGLHALFDMNRFRTVEQMATLGGLRAQGLIYIDKYDPPYRRSEIGFSSNLLSINNKVNYKF